jgi:hypothetical protein
VYHTVYFMIQSLSPRMRGKRTALQYYSYCMCYWFGAAGSTREYMNFILPAGLPPFSSSPNSCKQRNMRY